MDIQYLYFNNIPKRIKKDNEDNELYLQESIELINSLNNNVSNSYIFLNSNILPDRFNPESINLYNKYKLDFEKLGKNLKLRYNNIIIISNPKINFKKGLKGFFEISHLAYILEIMNMPKESKVITTLGLKHNLDLKQFLFFLNKKCSKKVFNRLSVSNNNCYNIADLIKLNSLCSNYNMPNLPISINMTSLEKDEHIKWKDIKSTWQDDKILVLSRERDDYNE